MTLIVSSIQLCSNMKEIHVKRCEMAVVEILEAYSRGGSELLHLLDESHSGKLAHS